MKPVVVASTTYLSALVWDFNHIKRCAWWLSKHYGHILIMQLNSRIVILDACTHGTFFEEQGHRIFHILLHLTKRFLLQTWYLMSYNRWSLLLTLWVVMSLENFGMLHQLSTFLWFKPTLFQLDLLSKTYQPWCKHHGWRFLKLRVLSFTCCMDLEWLHGSLSPFMNFAVKIISYLRLKTTTIRVFFRSLICNS